MKALTVTTALIVTLLIASTGSQSLADTHYVDINNLAPVSPYTNWVSAATNIKDAVDQAINGDTVVVNDGHYRLSSQISVSDDIIIESVNGPDVTIVDGEGTTRCFYLGNTASVLSGFKVINGSTSSSGSGAGIYCTGTTPTITNCTITGNTGGGGSGYGGGIYKGTAYNCTIASNTATYGGGIARGIAYNCNIAINFANMKGSGTYITDVTCPHM